MYTDRIPLNLITFHIYMFTNTDTPMGRSIMFSQAKKTVDKASGGFYPAPYKILDVLQSNYGKSKDEHLRDEAKKFSELAATSVSESLIGTYTQPMYVYMCTYTDITQYIFIYTCTIGIFKGTTEVKKHSFGHPTTPVKTIAVLGAGLMGAGIAQVSVDTGKYRVLLKDKDQIGVMRGEKTIDDAMKAKVKKRKMTGYEYSTVSSRLVPLHDGIESWKRHFGNADLVIEAVFEELSVKHKVMFISMCMCVHICVCMYVYIYIYN